MKSGSSTVRERFTCLNKKDHPLDFCVAKSLCRKYSLTKASAKADNLITALKTGRLMDVGAHPNFRTLMEHKASLSTLVPDNRAQKGKSFSSHERPQDLSCTNFPRRTISGDVCGDSAYEGAN